MNQKNLELKISLYGQDFELWNREKKNEKEAENSREES
jgi:hypothetical protein